MKYLLAALAFSTQLVIAQAPASAPVASAPAAVAGNVSGKVVETMNTAGYTYVLVDAGSKKVWAAAVQFPVKVGDAVSFAAGEPMENYHSKSLNRDFDLVYFTGGITVNAGAAASTAATPALPAGHPPLTAPPAKVKVDLTGIKKAAGGQTVAEIFAGKATLAGKSVTVRGKVVKYNAQIMGKNWLHLQDGSGSADNRDNDLAVTTATAAKVGDTVLVTGKVSANKDFGAGYKYAVILDDAQVTVE
jgi:hypothetical protein